MLNLTSCMDNAQIKDSYKSIAGQAKGLFKDNGSRFIAHAYHVETEEEVKEIVAALKKGILRCKTSCLCISSGIPRRQVQGK